MKDEHLCECENIHDEAVTAVREALPSEEKLYDLADFYKAFADSTRVRILFALDKKVLCVCDLAALLGMTVSAVSHQLRTLRDADLVKTRREGKTVFYSLADEHVRLILECGMDHICEEEKA